MPKSKRAITVVVEEVEMIELTRILIDDDPEAAPAFLKRHVKAKELWEGG